MEKKLKLSSSHKTISISDFLRIIKMTGREFKYYLEKMNHNEIICFKALIDKICSQVAFDNVCFYERDWFGRSNIRISIFYPNGKIDWAVLANYDLYQFVEIYSFGLYKCLFTFDDLIAETLKVN